MKKIPITAVVIIILVVLGAGLYAHSKRNQEALSPVVEHRQCSDGTYQGFDAIPEGSERQLVHILAVATSASTTQVLLFVDPIEECTEEEWENVATTGCFYKNTKEEYLPLPVAPDVQVFMQTLHHDAEGNNCLDESISFSALLEALRAEDSHYPNLPYLIETKNGTIQKIVERYIP